jgi:Methyltransferase domain
VTIGSNWEDPGFWEQYGRAAYYEDRRSAVIDLIPSTTRSVLDVGSGRAEIINQLPRAWQVVGMDVSRQALNFNLRHRVQASADRLPFPARAFDVVICLEVLEHLDAETFARATAELERVTGQTLILGLPIQEDLRRRHVRCPSCRHISNADGHLRSFSTESSIAACFPGLGLAEHVRLGPPTRPIPRALLALVRDVLGIFPPWEAFLVCPRCGYARPGPPPATPRESWTEWILRQSSRVSRANPYWTICRFVRGRSATGA